MRKFNFKLIARITGTLLMYFACSMVIPLLVSLYYKDGAQFSFIVSGMVILLLGMLLRNIVGRNVRYDLKEIESYWITFIIWLVVPMCGTVPYLVTGAIGTVTDAVFESFSGFTTTGSSIVALPEELPLSLLVYRSFTQWVGGIGLLLFVVAILRKLGIGAGQLYEAEFSGARHRKLHPHLSKSVTRMWTLYTLITLAMVGLLYWVGEVRFGDAICLALSTVSTGGFAPDNGGMAMLTDGGLVIVTVFMMLSGISLVRLYQLFTFRWTHLRHDQELHCYLAILFSAVALCVVAFCSVGNGFKESLQYSLFHVASTMSSTGFYVAKPAHWSFFVSAITFLLILLGASAGSTGGGIKIWRVIAVVKYMGNYFTNMLHPNAVTCVKINGQVVETDYINKIFAFVFLYMAFIVGGAFVLTLCGCTIPNSICMAAANVSNLGPSPLINNLGGSLDYAMLPNLAKWTLTVLMLAGRLELFALIAVFSPAYWKRRI
ncbi:MAG: hypothetical protein MJZ99_03025 [Bacteroidales bacterium]|nr:hypothetical protein [Candidatus Colimorpha merdihippi]MCQ2281581.1 hypothetical protein [Bacteroidales bacterium]